MLAYRARFAFPIDAPPIADAIVAIDHDRIVAVCAASSATGQDLAGAAVDLGDVAILPGLINPHTHLEFSDLPQPIGKPGIAFPDWIRLVVQHRRQQFASDPEGTQLLPRIRQGIMESSRFGVTTIGEIASPPWASIPPGELDITQFHECIGLRLESAEAMIQRASSIEDTFADERRFGISPHAPYSVHPKLLQACIAISADRKIPLAHHLAESQEEMELLRTGSGPFVDLLEELQAWEPSAIPPNARPLNYLQKLAQAHRALVIHGNYLDLHEIEFLGQHADNLSVVYCPKTHAFFDHKPYPLSEMLSAGVNVAIGTDSRASNPDLSPLAELRHVNEAHPLVPPALLLRMVTLNAAKALGRDRETGSLTTGKLADLAIVKLADLSYCDPHELILDPKAEVVATVFRGRNATPVADHR